LPKTVVDFLKSVVGVVICDYHIVKISNMAQVIIIVAVVVESLPLGHPEGIGGGLNQMMKGLHTNSTTSTIM